MSRLGYIGSGLVALLSMPAVKATEDLKLTEDAFFSELPVVLHATRLKQSIDETPASMTVIDRRMIEASSATTIAELLRYVPGFQLSYRSGDEAVVGYHGIEDQYSRRVQVLIDGHAVYSQAFLDSTLWSSLPITLDDVERIEVVRGSNASAYGAGAFLGSINIVTLDTVAAAGTRLRVDSGNNMRIRTSMRHAGSSGSLDYRVLLDYEDHHGLANRHDDVQAKRISLQGSWKVNTTDRIEFSAGYRDAEQGAGYVAVGSDNRYDRFVDSSYQQLSWRRINAADDEIQFSFNHNRLLVDDVNETEIFPIDNSFISDHYDLELQQISRLSDALRFVWGAGASYESIDAPGFYNNWFQLFNPDATNSGHQWRLFGNAEWSITPALLLNFGLMYENPDRTDDFVSSRIGLNYRINDEHGVRVGASRSFRAPSFYEQYSNFGYLWDGIAPPPPGSLAESLDSIELGYLGHFLDRRMALDLKLFYHDFNDRILLWDEFGYEIYARLEDYRQAGFEAQLSYGGESDSLHLGYSYVGLLESNNSEIIDRFFQSSPKHTLSMLYAHRFDNDWLGSLSLFYVDTMRWNFAAAVDDPVTWVDLKLAKNIKSMDGDLNLALTMQNIFDEEGADLRGREGGERRLLLSAKYSF
jgi:iron complex outermembrane receptor protein